jgi:uncharacterized membrane protein YedE/YeeE
MNWLRMPRWSPYVAGTLIGVLSWAAFVSVDKPIGVSTAVAKTMGMLERAVAPAHVDGNAYFQKFKPAIDWEWMLVLGLAAGAWLSSRLSGDKPSADPPALWRSRFGESKPLRYAAAFLGGVLLMFGARIAGGCTSGHGISGSLQLALSSWIFFLTLFVSGLVTAAILYRQEARRG